MRRLLVMASADYELPEEMFLTLMVEPPLRGAHHHVAQESLRTTPVPRCTLEQDLYGNPQRRVRAPRGFFTFDFTATIEVDTPHRDVRQTVVGIESELAPTFESPTVAGFLYDAQTILYTFPSRFCPSDLLTRMAHEKFGTGSGAGSGLAQVHAIHDWTHRRVHFIQERECTATRTAVETVTQREGGRQEIAHLVITFCRALGLPARYVSGYALGLEPNDFHAWAQVFVGDTWHDVDATSLRPRTALVPIAVGRDAADVPIFHGWGRGAMCRDRSVSVEEA